MGSIEEVYRNYYSITHPHSRVLVTLAVSNNRVFCDKVSLMFVTFGLTFDLTFGLLMLSKKQFAK